MKIYILKEIRKEYGIPFARGWRDIEVTNLAQKRKKTDKNQGQHLYFCDIRRRSHSIYFHAKRGTVAACSSQHSDYSVSEANEGVSEEESVGEVAPLTITTRRAVNRRKEKRGLPANMPAGVWLARLVRQLRQHGGSFHTHRSTGTTASSNSVKANTPGAGGGGGTGTTKSAAAADAAEAVDVNHDVTLWFDNLFPIR